MLGNTYSAQKAKHVEKVKCEIFRAGNDQGQPG